jgi:hypothetical protein
MGSELETGKGKGCCEMKARNRRLNRRKIIPAYPVSKRGKAGQGDGKQAWNQSVRQPTNRSKYNRLYNTDRRSRALPRRNDAEATDIHFDAYEIERLLKLVSRLVKRAMNHLGLLKDPDTAGRPPPNPRPVKYHTPSKSLRNLGGVK